MESVAGVAAGAFVLAFLENARRRRTRRFPTSFQDALSFTLLVVALVAFPQGIAGAFSRWLPPRRRAERRMSEGRGRLLAVEAAALRPAPRRAPVPRAGHVERHLERRVRRRSSPPPGTSSEASRARSRSATRRSSGSAPTRRSSSRSQGVDPYATLPLAAAAGGGVLRRRSGLPTFRLRGPVLHDRHDRRLRGGAGRGRRASPSRAGPRGLRMPAGSFDFARNYAAMVDPRGRGRGARRRGSRRARSGRRSRRSGRTSTPPRRSASTRRGTSCCVARALGGARRGRGRPLRDQLPVHRARLRLRLPALALDRPDADRRRRRDRRRARSSGRSSSATSRSSCCRVPALRDSYLFLYGGLLILVMLFEPKGLLGLCHRLRRAVDALRRRGRCPMPAEAILAVEGLTKRFDGLLALSGRGLRGLGRARSSASSAQRRRQDDALLLPGGIGPRRPPATIRFARRADRAASRTTRIVRARARADAPDRAAVPRHDGRARTSRSARTSARGRRRGEDARRRVAAILERTGLAREAGALAGTLTIGELKRLEIARALATEPRGPLPRRGHGRPEPLGDRGGDEAHPLDPRVRA